LVLQIPCNEKNRTQPSYFFKSLCTRSLVFPGIVKHPANLMTRNFYLLFAAFFTFAVCTTHAQIITTYAGNGAPGYMGDNSPATNAELGNPVGGVAIDASGNLYIADVNNYCVRKVSAAGVITTFAGGSPATATGDGGPATAAYIKTPHAVAVDAAGNVYIADQNNLIRKVTVSTGIITTVAGNGASAATGDGGPATAASINQPQALAIDASGNIYIADYGNNKIRLVTASTGKISTFAGNGTPGSTGDGSPATAAELKGPSGLAIDAAGNVYISDLGNSKIREVLKSNGNIIAYAGNGTAGPTGDGMMATAVEFNSPAGLAIDISGSLYVADAANNRIRRVSAASGIVTTVVGNGSPAYLGDNGPATAAEISDPVSITFDATGNMFISDAYNNRIRKVTPIHSIEVLGSNTTVCVTKTSNLSDVVTGGTWSSSNTIVATVGSSSGVVTGVGTGTATISYKTTTDGASATVTVTTCKTAVSTASPIENELKVYPNPTYGVFNINISSAYREEATITITNLVGMKVKELNANTNEAFDIKMDAPPGIYFLTATTLHERWSEKITLLH